MTNQWQRWKNIMKAYPFEEKRLLKWQPPFIVQPKYNGVRCRAVPLKNGNYLLLSSEENVIFSVPHINKMFEKLGLKAEFDGELYIHGHSFEQIVSITSRTKNLHPQHEKMQFHLFDIINELPQMKRTLMLENLRKLSPWLVVAPFWLCENLENIMEVFDNLTSEGYEGIIVRHFEAPYVRKRSTYVMKFKPKQHDIYEIVGYKEEISIDGLPKNALGALICDSGDGHTFDVGTGFTRKEREELWEMRGMLKGLKVKVNYQHITSGKKVPRFPVFSEVIYE